ncbi:MAG: DUF1579 family protein [Pseudomonadota bacterium]
MNRTAVSAVLGAFSLFAAAPTASAQALTESVPPTAAEPHNAMKALDALHGEWTSLTEMRGQDGEWQTFSKDLVVFEPLVSGLLLAERHVERISGAGFVLLTSFSYDQYRDLYRTSVVDETFGLMDIYEGDAKDDVLTMTNLRSGTSFPTDDGEMFFKLRIPLTGDTRVMDVDVSTDKGETWAPLYRMTYERAG